MHSLADILFRATDIISIDSISILAKENIVSFVMPLALFTCVLLIINAFSKYKFLSFRIFCAWIISCLISLFVISSGDLNNTDELNKAVLVSSLNAQIILSFLSSVIMFIFYIFTLLGNKARARKKNFGYNRFWIAIVSFVVLCAFCCLFNIMLFVAWKLFY